MKGVPWVVLEGWHGELARRDAGGTVVCPPCRQLGSQSKAKLSNRPLRSSAWKITV